MKKIIALLFVCGFAIALVSCGGKKAEEASTTVDSAATVVEQVVDSVAAPVDSVATDAAVAQ